MSFITTLNETVTNPWVRIQVSERKQQQKKKKKKKKKIISHIVQAVLYVPCAFRGKGDLYSFSRGNINAVQEKRSFQLFLAELTPK